MTRPVAYALAVLALTLCAGTTFADPPPAKMDQSTMVAPVTVPGKAKKTPQLEKRVTSYVTTVLAKTPEHRVMSWTDPVCPLVGGIAVEQGEYVLARMTQVMQEVGAPVAPETCHVNLFVIITDQPERLLDGWYKRDKNLFGYVSQKKALIFIDTPKPVRVWYNAHITKPGGIPFAVSTGTYGTSIENNHVDDTRLARNDQLAAQSVLIIADSRQLNGIKLQQLADYALMLGLTEIEPDANVGDASTILTLFRKRGPGDEPAPDGLSTWDRAFLSAVYHSNATSVMQRDLIVDRIVNDVSQ